MSDAILSRDLARLPISLFLLTYGEQISVMRSSDISVSGLTNSLAASDISPMGVTTLSSMYFRNTSAGAKNARRAAPM